MPSPSQPRSSFEHSGSIHLRSNPNADILTSRPGFSGISGMDLTWCKSVQPPQHRSLRAGAPINPLCANPGVLKNPVVEEVGALPSGTSAPNIVLTEHAIQSSASKTPSRRGDG